MSQVVHLEVFYPYPPERVWQVLTSRHALTDWMMENDFEPKLGHKFQFYSHPLPGITTTIQCEVVELEEPTRLVYTWKEFSTVEPSLVIWTLTTVAGGTQLCLRHHQYSYTTAVAALNRSDTTHQAEQFYSRTLPPTSRVEAPFFDSSFQSETSSNSSSIALQNSFPPGVMTSEFSNFGIADWRYFLNQRLPDLLNR